MTFISPENGILLTRLSVAVILGMLIGIQRERRKLVDRSYGSAGLRTHALVCLGTALIVSTFAVLVPLSVGVNLPSIMIGIGFIGAGTIISNQGKIKGLANAESIWVTAALGISVGLGLFMVSVAATILSILVLELRRFEAID